MNFSKLNQDLNREMLPSYPDINLTLPAEHEWPERPRTTVKMMTRYYLEKTAKDNEKQNQENYTQATIFPTYEEDWDDQMKAEQEQELQNKITDGFKKIKDWIAIAHTDRQLEYTQQELQNLENSAKEAIKTKQRIR